MAIEVYKKALSQGVKLFVEQGELKIKAKKGALSQALLAEIRTYKADLIVLIEDIQEAKSGAKEEQIQPCKRDGSPLVLSATQQGIWVMEQINPGNASHNLPYALQMSGDLDAQLLSEAFNAIVQRHEVLRTSFVEVDGIPQQRISQQARFELKQMDLSDLDEQSAKQRCDELAAAEAAKPFDLTCGLLLRGTLVKLTSQQHMLLLTQHHLVSDGWSYGLVIDEVCSLYQALKDNKPNPLPQLPIQFADYCAWEQQWLNGPQGKAAAQYWRDKLKNVGAFNGFETDYARPQTPSYKGGILEQLIEKPLADKLTRLAADNGVTLFMLLSSTFALLYKSYTDSDTLVVGTPVANREKTEVANLLGCFINNLVLTCDLSNNPTFSQLLAQTKQDFISALQYQSYPFTRVVETLCEQRQSNMSPIFQVMLVMQNNAASDLAIPGLTLTPGERATPLAEYDLTVDFIESDKGLFVDWTYATELFERDSIEQISGHFARLLELVASGEDLTVNQTRGRLLSEGERLAQLHDCHEDHDSLELIHHVFETKAANLPDNIALVFEQHSLTFAELNQRANQLAHYLVTQHQVKPDTLVGLCAERSVEMVVAIIAILKAGGAYVPLDPDYPEARLRYMIEDAGMDVVLTQSALAQRLSGFNVAAVAVDTLELDDQRQTNLSATHTGVGLSNLAYVIYTSGSTGKPKGVMVEHKALYNRIRWMDKQYGMTPQDKVLQKTPYSFDVSVWEFVWTLAYGGQLVVAKPQGHKDPEYLCDLIMQHQITKLHFVPSMLGAILECEQFAECDSIEQVFCSGEALQQSHVKGFTDALPNAQLHNLYGPTEAAIDVSYFDCRGDITHGVPIGRAIDNIQLLVLDQNLNMVPQGVVGELHIGGMGLARGYLNRDALTHERFVANPYYDASKLYSSPRLYKTGDLARLGRDGQLAYQGRTDHQVKIRGLRIELGEIEHQLAGIDTVDSSLVIAAELSGSTQLVAYVKAQKAVTEDESAEYVSQLKQQLGVVLPDYMVPNIIVVLEEWPLSANGKVDRKALPAVESGMSHGEYVAPQNEAEHKLVAIWAELLNIDAQTISTSADFFELGGHSLLATRVVSRVRSAFEVELPVKALFDHPTVAQLALSLSGYGNATVMPPIVATDRSKPLPLSFGQQRLWFIDQLEQGSSHYNMPSTFVLKGDFNEQAFESAMAGIIERHEVLRTSFVDIDGNPSQVIRAKVELPVSYVDLQHLEGEEQQASVAALEQADSEKAFDLSNDVLLRAKVLRLSANDAVVLFNMHHIVSDGWSISVLTDEFNRLYQAAQNGVQDPLPELAIQYGDYTVWQRQWLTGQVLDDQLSWWLDELDGIAQIHNLPLDKPRPNVQTLSGGYHNQLIDSRLSEQIEHLCQVQGATLFMVMHTSLSLLFGRYSNSEDMVIGTAIAGRAQEALTPLIGLFVNDLVIRCRFDGKQSFSALLQQQKMRILSVYDHQHVPFEMVVESLNPERNLGYNPVMQLKLDVQNNEQIDLAVQGPKVEGLGRDLNNSRYDISISIEQHADGLSVSWNYNDEVFLPDTIESMAGSFAVLLNNICVAPDTEVSKLDMLSEHEKTVLLEQYPDTDRDFATERLTTNGLLHEQFEQVAEQRGEGTALVCDGETISYEELNENANEVAHYLLKQGVKPDTLVGICMERSIDLITGILGILKAGGAYVPIDPAYPQSRIDYILQDAGVEHLLCDEDLMSMLPLTDQKVFPLDSDLAERMLSMMDCENPQVELSENNLAYVIYTSGSTGKPKGVMLEHKGVLNTALAMAEPMRIDNDSRIMHMTSISFDAAVFEWIIALLNGAQLHICDEITKSSNKALSSFLLRQQITHAFIPPALLNQLPLRQDYAFKCIMAGGEAIEEPLAHRWGEHYYLLNGYGPTEASMCASLGQLLPGEPVHIGKSVFNGKSYVLGSHGEVLPHGAVGELCIAGAGLARGYLNRPDLTERQFIERDLGQGAQTRMYRTGDLVRFERDGRMKYCGRADDQIKLRGFRIELGEIQAQLCAFDAVREAVVMLWQDDKQPGRLVAYLVPVDAIESDDDELVIREKATRIRLISQQLKQKLPGYMVPEQFIVVERMPLNSSGKIDKKALPSPASEAFVTAVYVAPTTPLEGQLCDIWQQVLELPQVGIKDNFFEIGGHSLLATKVVSMVRARFDCQLSVKDLFEYNTIEQLATLVEQGSQSVVLPAIEKACRSQKLPLSFAQQRLWFIDQLAGGAVHYNMPATFKLNGQFKQQAFENALKALIERHEVLRTHITTEDNEPYQVIKTRFDLPLSYVDLSRLEDAVQRRELAELERADTALPFDLGADIMLRVKVVHLSEDSQVVLFNMHHIATDGWSMAILIREFNALFAAYSQDEGKGEPPQLPTLEVQYADYANWQRQWLQGEVYDNYLNYWQTQLQGIPQVHELPLDRARPPVQSYAGRVLNQQLDANMKHALEQLCLSQEVTLFMLLHTAFSVFVGRYSHAQDVVVSTANAGRNHAELNNVVGLFVNDLVIRCELGESLPFSDLLAQQKTRILGAFEHQHMPFERLVEALNPERSLQYNPLVQLKLDVQNNEQNDLALAQTQTQGLGREVDANLYDLYLSVEQHTHGLSIDWKYSTELFEHDTIARMAENFVVLLQGIIATPQCDVHMLPLVAVQQQQTLIEKFNDTQVDYDKSVLIHQWFEGQVDAAGDKPAVVFEGESVSYAQLNQRANRLARYLQSMGVVTGSLVGICLERSIDMVVSILASLKAGCAYVPVDPEFPQQRIQDIVADTQLKHVLSHKEWVVKMALPESVEVIVLDTLDEQLTIAQFDSANLSAANQSSNQLAYVIYTSGSTGKPKGVMVEHQALVNRIDWMQSTYGLTAADKVLQKTPYSFDVSVWEFLWTLSSGATLVVAKPQGHKSPEYLQGLIAEQGISVLHFVPSMLSAYLSTVNAMAPSVRYLFCSGEALDAGLVEQMKADSAHVGLHNLYGPTEAAIDVTFFDCDQWDGQGSVPIGKAIQNTRLYVLDRNLQLCPLGCSGELFIGGDNLARGYLNNPGLSDERFIANPFAEGERLYRTGDLVRYLTDGSLQYLGRTDSQVKVRGFRIELGEIETTLLTHPDVREAAVLAVDEPKRLVAYVVGERADTQQLREYLSGLLPQYMIPGLFVAMDKMPLTVSGKIDRKALPSPDTALSDETTYVAAQNPVQQQLCDIWQQLLGQHKVGIEQDFFASGGHSLLAIKLAMTISERFETSFESIEVFRLPTIALQAQWLENHKGEGRKRQSIEPRPQGAEIPLTPSQQRLWFINHFDPDNVQYNLPFAARLNGALDVVALQQAFEVMLARHEILRTRFVKNEKGEVTQVVGNLDSFELAVVSLSHDGLETAHKLATEEQMTPFDLARELPIRASLIALEDDTHVLLLTLHHIATDGWSMGLLIAELSDLYNRVCCGETPSSQPLPLQYGDYAYACREQFSEQSLDDKIAFWRTQLAGIPATHGLPLDRLRPPVIDASGGLYQDKLDAQTTKQLRRMAQQHNVTMFMVVQAALAALIYRQSGMTDVVMGTPVANRDNVQLRDMVGCFVNTLVVRSDLSSNPTFAQLLAQAKAYMHKAHAHQDLPFETLVEKLQPQRSLDHTPLFQIMLNFVNNNAEQLSFSNVAIEPLASDSVIAKFDLTLNAADDDDGLVLGWEYATSLFDRSTIANMAGQMKMLLKVIAFDAESAIDDIGLLDEAQKIRLAQFARRDEAGLADDVCLHQLFEANVKANPDAIAVKWQDRQLSYGELNAAADKCAGVLLERGLKPGQAVGVCLPRSEQMVIAVLGILKAGGAYLSLDPNYPQSRLQYMVQDAGAQWVIGNDTLTVQLGECELLDINQMLDTPEVDLAEVTVTPQNLAYLIYTSGSTGQPKGVVICHKNATSMINWALAHYSKADLREVLASTSLNFDLSVFELFLPLAAGTTMVLVDNIMALADNPQLQPSLINTVPSGIEALLALDKVPASAEVINLAGEPLPATIVNKLLGEGVKRRVYNLYGPSEATTYSTYCEFTQPVERAPGIGRPLENTRCYVLDSQQKQCPVGVVGELYIGGQGVASGYINKAEVTAQKFITLSEIDSGRDTLYRTGDLVRWRNDGQLEYIGRADDQVKLRGFRIELGDIEFHLECHQAVAKSVVVVKSLPSGEQHLVAYVTGSRDMLDEIQLKDYLSSSLPAHMVPGYFVLLDKFPYTPNGKVDKARLPLPELDLVREYQAPQGETEQALALRWAEVLGLAATDISRDDSFFNLGGHSLLAMRLMVELKQHFKVAVTERQLFENPTLASFALVLERSREGQMQQDKFISLTNTNNQDGGDVLTL